MNKMLMTILEANLEIAQIDQEIADLEVERVNIKSRIKILDCRKKKIVSGLNRLKLEVEKSKEAQLNIATSEGEKVET